MTDNDMSEGKFFFLLFEALFASVGILHAVLFFTKIEVDAVGVDAFIIFVCVIFAVVLIIANWCDW